MRGSNGNMGLNVIYLMIILFVFALLGVVGYQILDDLNNSIQENDELSNTSKDQVQDITNRYPSTIDGAFATIMVLALLSFAIIGYFSGSHPVLLFIPIVVLIASLTVAGIFSNVWEDFTDTEQITFEDQFPIMDFVLNNFLVDMLVAGVAVALGRYVAGGRRGGGPR